MRETKDQCNWTRKSIQSKSKRKKKLFELTGKAMCWKSNNVKNKIWEAPRLKPNFSLYQVLP